MFEKKQWLQLSQILKLSNHTPLHTHESERYFDHVQDIIINHTKLEHNRTRICFQLTVWHKVEHSSHFYGVRENHNLKILDTQDNQMANPTLINTYSHIFFMWVKKQTIRLLQMESSVCNFPQFGTVTFGMVVS